MPLADGARGALAGPVYTQSAGITPNAASLALGLPRGSHLVRRLRYAAWARAGHRSPVVRQGVRTAAIAFESRFGARFFGVWLDRMTELERSYLRVMAGLKSGPLSYPSRPATFRLACGAPRNSAASHGRG